jgi:hypothetical protein
VTDEIREQVKYPIMEILVKREYKKKDYTIGKMYINGEYFCDTLEDTDRGLKQDMPLSELKELKEYGRTAIPTGEYFLTNEYSNRFKKMLPLIHNVPAFEGVRIHSGNTHEDTEGCLLLGVATNPEEKGWVSDSRKTLNEFMKVIAYAKNCNKDENITIRIE